MPASCSLPCLLRLQVPFAVVFTKCDARKKGGPTPGANIKAFKTELLKVRLNVYGYDQQRVVHSTSG
jgi:hypothetical protein